MVSRIKDYKAPRMLANAAVFLAIACLYVVRCFSKHPPKTRQLIMILLSKLNEGGDAFCANLEGWRLAEAEPKAACSMQASSSEITMYFLRRGHLA